MIASHNSVGHRQSTPETCLRRETRASDRGTVRAFQKQDKVPPPLPTPKLPEGGPLSWSGPQRGNAIHRGLSCLKCIRFCMPSMRSTQKIPGGPRAVVTNQIEHTKALRTEQGIKRAHTLTRHVL
jgi:hypothetical protein